MCILDTFRRSSTGHESICILDICTAVGLLDIFRTIETLILSPYPEDNFVELTWLGWSYLDLIGANWDLLGIYECT